MDLGYIKFVLFKERDNWPTALDKRAGTGRQMNGLKRAKWPHVLRLCSRCRLSNFGCRKSNIETLQLVVLFQKATCALHTDTRGLNGGYVRTAIDMCWAWQSASLSAVGMSYEHQISPPLPAFLFYCRPHVRSRPLICCWCCPRY